MRMVQSLVQLTCSYESLPTSGMFIIEDVFIKELGLVLVLKINYQKRIKDVNLGLLLSLMTPYISAIPVEV